MLQFQFPRLRSDKEALNGERQDKTIITKETHFLIDEPFDFFPLRILN